MIRIFLIFFLFLPFKLSTLQAEEACSKVSCYPLTMTHQGVAFYLVGKADFTYLFTNIYSIGLYTTSENFKGNVLDSGISKLLHFKYHRKIEKYRLVDGADDTLKDNPNFDYQEFINELAKVNFHYTDVDQDSQLLLSYFPEKGLMLGTPEKTLITVNNPKFAEYYLGIWLSEYPLSQRVRKQLLGAK